MVTTEVLIIGGGPAGSACAWRLRQRGIDCIVLDQYTFPRFKPCAGWITPLVVKNLQLDPAEYPHSFTTFDALYLTIYGRQITLRTRQHAIRRYEFDDWLLRRSAAPVFTHTVKTIQERAGNYVVDGEYSGKYLVGAGGTYCPVYRELFRPEQPRQRGALIAAQEAEFAYPAGDPTCQLWFLEDHLPGYAWYVPKANGWVNVGVGGKAEEMNRNGDNIKNHWARLVDKLARQGLVQGCEYKPVSHTYYLRQPLAAPSRGNAFLVGDSAGLATQDMGEGISAAVQSGLRAADAIATGGEYALKGIPRYSLFPGVILESIGKMFRRALQRSSMSS